MNLTLCCSFLSTVEIKRVRFVCGEKKKFHHPAEESHPKFNVEKKDFF